MLSELSLNHIAAWQWFFAAGVVLMLLELCLPAFFLLWIGLACLCTAGTVVLLGLGAMGQLLSFCCFSLVSLTVGYFFYARKSMQNQHQGTTDLNNRSEQLIGQLLTLEQAISAGNGEHAKCYININDTRWTVRSVNALAIDSDTQVRVVSIKGNTLIVDVV